MGGQMNRGTVVFKMYTTVVKKTCLICASWEARHAPAYAHKFSDGREQSCAHIPTMSYLINSLANFGHQPTPAHKDKIPGKQFAADLMQSEME